jgi:tRNA(adenine34) deaminase
MKLAFDQAVHAKNKGEVPVGAVLVNSEGYILAQDHNRTITRCDPTAHAEINVLREAALILGNYRLLSTSLYVTIEPCIMCMGALIHARVDRIIYGAPDSKWGAAGSLCDFSQVFQLNHRPTIVSGIYEAKCKELIQDFFRNKRIKPKN